ncbi:MAG: hypothetical protein WBD20_24700, partial [Pirellulaceae bacterium]
NQSQRMHYASKVARLSTLLAEATAMHMRLCAQGLSVNGVPIRKGPVLSPQRQQGSFPLAGASRYQ